MSNGSPFGKTPLKIQTEISVGNYSFVSVKPSSVGFASLANATNVLGLDARILGQFILSLGKHVVDTQEVYQIQAALYSAVSNMASLRSVCGQQSRRADISASAVRPKRRQSHTISPRAVCEAAQLA